MSIQTKVAGSWKNVTQPWVKVDTAYQRATKVWIKVNDVWVETWPLKPNPPGSPVATTVYRNDRIEIDVDWLMSVGAETAAKYLVTVQIGTSASGPFSYSTTVTVNVPTVALTLTNTPSNSGYHIYAGKKVYVSIVAQSAAGRNSDPAVAPAVTVAQLPAPPVPATYSVTCVACALSHTWTNDSGRRVDGVEMQVQFNGVGTTTVKYADTVKSASYDTWNPATIGGGTVLSRIRTYGPGGVSAWKTVTGTMPSPIATSNYRFLNGLMRVTTSGINPSAEVWYLHEGGSWTNSNVDAAAGATSITVGVSSGWAHDNDRWAMLLRPINNANGWTGRDQNLGYIRKIPDPYIISPEWQSATRWQNAWREGDTEWQGASTHGNNTCYAFYGDRWYDQLRSGNLGYIPNVTSAQISLHRETVGGSASPVRPRLMVHRAIHGYGDISFAGAYDTTALGRGSAAWCPVPTDWVEMLMQRSNGYRGFGLYHSNTTLLQGLGYVSAEYMILKSSEAGSLSGYPLFTVRVYHDG